jgi:hypothetical protein
MNVLTLAAQVARRVNEQQGSLTFTTPDGVTTMVIAGMPASTSVVINEFGERVISQGNNARVTVHCGTLAALSYPAFNGANQCTLKGHKVSWVDVTGNTLSTIITEPEVDLVTGLIKCRVGKFS